MKRTHDRAESGWARGRLVPACCLVLAALSSALAAEPASVREVENRLLEKAAANVEKYRKGPATLRFVDPDGRPVTPRRIRVEQTGHDFLFGCIIFDLVRGDPYEPDLYRKRFKELFNFAVFPFYWGSYEPTPGMPRWEEMLRVVEWCKQNGITTKGHPLVWTHRAGTPQWLSRYSPELTEELLKSRVIRIVDGYAGKIDIWDVVNESVHMRTWLHREKPNYTQESLEEMADYVEKSFRWAHTGNPDATLILNDFGLIPDESMRNRFAGLVKELKSRNVPLCGLGLQAHEPRFEWFSPEEVWETYDVLGALGYPLHVTEFIPQSGGREITGGWREGKWTAEKQADFAEQFYRLSFGHPDVVSINWWGLSDRRIWLEGGGLITEEYQPKPVYERLHHLIHEEWKTSLSIGEIPDDGPVSFRGFYGDYTVTAETADGKTHTFRRHLEKDGDNRWSFTIGE